MKAIYTIVESDINEMNHWKNDDKFIAELDKRSADLKSGKDKGVPWEEIRMGLLSHSIKASKSKRS